MFLGTVQNRNSHSLDIVRMHTSTSEYQSFQLWYPSLGFTRTQSFQLLVLWRLARAQYSQLRIPHGLARTRSFHLLAPWGLGTSKWLRLDSQCLSPNELVTGTTFENSVVHANQGLKETTSD